LNPSSIHRLRIFLDNVEPAIWRELKVESEWPIDFVADSIRCAFGWSFDHAYKFVVKRRHYGTFNGWARLDPEQEYKERRRQIARQKLGPRQERQALKKLYAWLLSLRKDCEAEEDPIPSLMELAPRTGTKFKFVYDFGDRWEHTVRVERIQSVVPGTVYPRCIDGEGANPLEDCGGPASLMAVFNAVKHPEQPRNETIQHIVKDWVGEGWDFTRFSVEEVNQRIRKMFRSGPSPSE
jgi:hypothetical protein